MTKILFIYNYFCPCMLPQYIYVFSLLLPTQEIYQPWILITFLFIKIDLKSKKNMKVDEKTTKINKHI